MDYPSIQEAQDLLTWAGQKNPGPWEVHVKYTALAAKTIAEAAGMDGEKAYVLGLLHDIGRYEGYSHLRHVIAGYDLMMEKGYTDAARICLTHSFSIPQLSVYFGTHDCTPEDIARIEILLATTPQDDYDKLIQLCDALGAAEGIVVIEQRMMDVALRYGLIPNILEKWQATIDQKNYFAEKTGGSIYRFFDVVFI